MSEDYTGDGPVFNALMAEVMEGAARFGHREHVHLTWLAVRRCGVLEAVGLVSDGIQRTARYAGAPQKYHATISRAWVELVGYHVADSGESDFPTFADHHSALLDKRLLTRFYRQATLASPRARTGWVEPDLAPFPWLDAARQHCGQTEIQSARPTPAGCPGAVGSHRSSRPATRGAALIRADDGGVGVVGCGTRPSSGIRQPRPGDRIRHLPAQALVTQPVTELQEHQPQIALRRRRRPAEHRVEVRRERGEERRVIQQRIHPRELGRQPQHLLRQQRLPQRGLIACGAEHGLDPF